MHINRGTIPRYERNKSVLRSNKVTNSVAMERQAKIDKRIALVTSLLLEAIHSHRPGKIVKLAAELNRLSLADRAKLS